MADEFWKEIDQSATLICVQIFSEHAREIGWNLPVTQKCNSTAKVFLFS